MEDNTKRLLSQSPAVAAIGAARGADVPEELLDVSAAGHIVYSQELSWNTNLYSFAGGVSGDENGSSLPESAESEAAPDYDLAEAVHGMPFEAVEPDIRLGDYLKEFADDVDWEASVAEILESDSCPNGIVTVFPSATDAQKCILFTGGGVAEIPWNKNDGCSDTRTYTVARSGLKRPHSIFWTSDPHNAQPIDLSGKFVQLFGMPEIVKPIWGANSTSGSSNIVCGVYFDSSSRTLQAAARKLLDGTVDGPKGQLVVAHYDNGDYDDIVAMTTVEVSGPDANKLTAYVGEQLCPYGGGYDATGLHAHI